MKELTPLPVSVCEHLHKSPLQLGVRNLSSPINKVQFVNQHSSLLRLMHYNHKINYLNIKLYCWHI